MLIKFISERLTCTYDNGLFPINNGGNEIINNISSNIKNIFKPIVTENGNITIDRKQFGGKYAYIRYLNVDDNIGEIENLPMGDLLVLSLRIADNDEDINDNKEIINKKGTILMPISKEESIFSAYFIGIYIDRETTQLDNDKTMINGYVFYTQKGRNNIKLLVKDLLMNIMSGSDISLSPKVNKKRIEDFTGAINNIVFKTDYLPVDISPNIEENVKKSIMLSVKTEIKIKSTSRKDNIMTIFPGATRKIFKEIVDKKNFWGVKSLEGAEASIGGEKLDNLTINNDDIIGIVQDFKPMKNKEFNMENFKQLCIGFFN